jgi:NhaA family Na+:H+ antiporter
VSGDLRDPRRAVLPVVAAVCGMALPAGIYACWVAGSPEARGWAIPTATDIAFALAVLAVIGRHLPSGLRTFLLTLAVVDDLLAICVIAFFYTDTVSVWALLGAVLPIGLFGLVVRSRFRTPWLLVPLALVAWGLVHASGVHATVAGVVLALTVPAAAKEEEGRSLAETFEHVLRPLSAGVAVPVFAFFAAGVGVGGISGLRAAFGDHVTLGIITGLVVGKTVGIAGSTWLVSRFTGAELDEELGWVDVIGVSVLAGIGFTVSLLIGELAFGSHSATDDHVKVGVLAASLIAAALAALVLGRRSRRAALAD